MTELNQWKCDICGTVHKNKDDCVKCENGHVAVSGIDDARYMCRGEYPYKISINFKNGKRRTYKLISE